MCNFRKQEAGGHGYAMRARRGWGCWWGSTCGAGGFWKVAFGRGIIGVFERRARPKKLHLAGDSKALLEGGGIQWFSIEARKSEF